MLSERLEVCQLLKIVDSNLTISRMRDYRCHEPYLRRAGTWIHTYSLLIIMSSM